MEGLDVREQSGMEELKEGGCDQGSWEQRGKKDREQ